MRMLARLIGGEPAPLHQLAAPIRSTKLISLWRSGKLKKMWRYTRWLAKEAQAGRSARLSMHTCAPGDIAICERTLDDSLYERLKRQAAGAGVSRVVERRCMGTRNLCLERVTRKRFKSTRVA
jgi:hypothetical protein